MAAAEHRARALARVALLAGALGLLAWAGTVRWVRVVVVTAWTLASAGRVTCLRSRNVRRLLAGWPTGRLGVNHLLGTATVVTLHAGAVVAGRMGLQSLAAGEVVLRWSTAGPGVPEDGFSVLTLSLGARRRGSLRRADRRRVADGRSEGRTRANGTGRCPSSSLADGISCSPGSPSTPTTGYLASASSDRLRRKHSR